MVQVDYNVQEYEEPTFGDPIKPDWYAARISKIELVGTKNGDGSMLAFTFDIDENRHPELSGRKVWDRLNVYNKNEVAQKIARGTQKKIQNCVGKPVIQNTDELLGSMLLIKVAVQPATAEYEARNVIRDYKPLGEVPAATGVPGTTTTPGASHTPATASVPAQQPAWMRK